MFMQVLNQVQCPSTAGILEVRKLVGEVHTHLLLELGEGGRHLGEGLLGLGVQVLRADGVPIGEEVLHELLGVVHPQVGVALEGVLVLLSLLYGADDQAGHLLPHLYEVGHVFQVGLQGAGGAQMGERFARGLPALESGSLLVQALLTSQDGTRGHLQTMFAMFSREKIHWT